MHVISSAAIRSLPNVIAEALVASGRFGWRACWRPATPGRRASSCGESPRFWGRQTVPQPEKCGSPAARSNCPSDVDGCTATTGWVGMAARMVGLGIRLRRRLVMVRVLIRDRGVRTVR